MGAIDFNGTLPTVAITMKWSSGAGPGSPTHLIPNAPGPSLAQSFLRDQIQNIPYIVANDLITAFTITAQTSPALVIARRAATGKPLYDNTINAFVAEQVPGPALDALIDAKETTSCAIDMEFTYLEFFETLLAHMTDGDTNDPRSIANPKDEKAILAMFTRTAAGKDIDFVYKKKSEKVAGLPCKLADVEVKSRKPKSPAVKLVFALDFTPVDDTRRAIMRKLIALDWSKLVKHGQVPKKGQKLPERVRIWAENRDNFLLNQMHLGRGQTIRTEMFARHFTKTPQEISTDLRPDIDQHLITGNHWGQKREDKVAEPYHNALSDLFGSLHQKAFLASPVNAIRMIEFNLSQLRAGSAGTGLTADEYAALVLQCGVGHCGEHSDVSFSILSAIASDPKGKISRVVKTGNANSDHEFVIYDLDVVRVIKTITTNTANTRPKDNGDPMGAGSLVHVWNLRKTIESTAPRVGFTMDPYLDLSVMKPKVEDLLTALNNAERGSLKTDFLFFAGQTPKLASARTADLTSLTAAQRAKEVPGV